MKGGVRRGSRRALGLLICLSLVLAGVPLLQASPAPAEPVVVAVLDTGILPTHDTFEEGQVVAWYDFGRQGSPGVPAERWDPRVDPYDHDGHGTAVASLVAGTDDTNQTPSHAPGTALAIARVTRADGSAGFANVSRAIQWAVDVVDADVISLSIYSYTPQSAIGHPLSEALTYARENGVLPVVLAGNGMNNAGLPTASWLHPPASSPDALVVGAASKDGTPKVPEGSLDPEVTALARAQVACPWRPDCIAERRGTSISTPLVAGMAASLLTTARAEGLADPGPDRLEDLLRRSARDTLAPPSFEGYGYLDEQGLERARAHLRAGTLPPLEGTALLNQVHVDVVQDGARRAWSGQP